MKFSKTLARAGVLLFSALCLLVFQLANSILLGSKVALAQDEFPTLAPNVVTFTPAVEDGTPVPAAISEIVPGTRFEEGDPYLKSIDEEGIIGDKSYGYYEIPENPDAVLIWTTDGTGTHYLVVEKGSDILTGGDDPENGFYRLVQRREELEKANETARLNRDTHKETAGFMRGGSIVAFGAAIGCVVTGVIPCVVGLIGIGAAAFVASLVQDDDKGEEQNTITTNNEEIATIEGQMRFRQRTGQISGGSG